MDESQKVRDSLAARVLGVARRFHAEQKEQEESWLFGECVIRVVMAPHPQCGDLLVTVYANTIGEE